MANSLSRTEKLENISGEKYPRDFPGRETIESVLKNDPIVFTEVNSERFLPPRKMEVPNTSIRKIAGRISAKRNHSNNIFLDMFDQTGAVQLHIKTGPESNTKEIELYNRVWECDIGDMVGCEGTLEQNSRGEPLLLISNYVLLAKALKDPPANFHGVKNAEHKYRHREQDLLSSADSREVFKKRAEIVFEIRKYLNERDFVEIEAPVLQPIYGGATARPFKTKHNALGQEFFLSISSELYLKRAMVGGFDRVYSFSRCFRNEGISPEHNPEFTNLEIFESCKNHEDMAKLTQDLISRLCVFTGFSEFDDLLKKWEYYPDWHEGIWPIKKREEIEHPTFKTEMPASDWPLSRSYRKDKPLAEAWEMFYKGMEIASGASDLNDPREQEARLKESEKNMQKHHEEIGDWGDVKNPIEHDPYDKNYIEALETGALPWAGVGIGIDRLCMILLEKSNIRDTIMFPLLKTK